MKWNCTYRIGLQELCVHVFLPAATSWSELASVALWWGEKYCHVKGGLKCSQGIWDSISIWSHLQVCFICWRLMTLRYQMLANLLKFYLATYIENKCFISILFQLWLFPRQMHRSITTCFWLLTKQTYSLQPQNWKSHYWWQKQEASTFPKTHNTHMLSILQEWTINLYLTDCTYLKGLKSHRT